MGIGGSGFGGSGLGSRDSGSGLGERTLPTGSLRSVVSASYGRSPITAPKASGFRLIRGFPRQTGKRALNVVCGHLEECCRGVRAGDPGQSMLDDPGFGILTAAVHHQLQFRRDPPLPAAHTRDARGQHRAEPRPSSLNTPYRALPQGFLIEWTCVEGDEARHRQGSTKWFSVQPPLPTIIASIPRVAFVTVRASVSRKYATRLSGSGAMMTLCGLMPPTKSTRTRPARSR